MGMEERYDAYIAKDKEGVVYYTGTFEEESIQTIFYFVL